MCIVGELAGRGSMAVAVGVSDMWQATYDMWHLIFCFVLMLLSALIEKFCFSGLQDFYTLFEKVKQLKCYTVAFTVEKIYLKAWYKRNNLGGRVSVSQSVITMFVISPWSIKHILIFFIAKTSGKYGTQLWYRLNQKTNAPNTPNIMYHRRMNKNYNSNSQQILTFYSWEFWLMGTI